MTQRQGLYRSRTEKIFGGVCGGLAQSLNMDTFVVRLIFVILFLFAGGGILIYLIMWIALPEEPFPMFNEAPDAAADPGAGEPLKQSQDAPVYIPRQSNGALIAGLVLIGVGLVFLADRFIPTIHFRDFWPVVIVIVGLVLIASSFTKRK
jgi:phage shock protein C